MEKPNPREPIASSVTPGHLLTNLAGLTYAIADDGIEVSGRNNAMKSNAYLRLSAAIFAVVAVAHAVRAVRQSPLRFGSTDIPVWPSWIAVVVTGFLSAWGFSAARKS